jgi:hypothetical protein
MPTLWMCLTAVTQDKNEEYCNGNRNAGDRWSHRQ